MEYTSRIFNHDSREMKSGYRRTNPMHTCGLGGPAVIFCVRVLSSSRRSRSAGATLILGSVPRPLPPRPRRRRVRGPLEDPARWRHVLPPPGDPGTNTRRLHDRIMDVAEARPRHYGVLDEFCGHCSELSEVRNRLQMMHDMNIGHTTLKITRSLYTCYEGGGLVVYTARAYNRIVNQILAESGEHSEYADEYGEFFEEYTKGGTWSNMYDFTTDSRRIHWSNALIDLGLEVFERVLTVTNRP